MKNSIVRNFTQYHYQITVIDKNNIDDGVKKLSVFTLKPTADNDLLNLITDNENIIILNSELIVSQPFTFELSLSQFIDKAACYEARSDIPRNYISKTLNIYQYQVYYVSIDTDCTYHKLITAHDLKDAFKQAKHILSENTLPYKAELFDELKGLYAIEPNSFFNLCGYMFTNTTGFVVINCE